MTAGAARTAAPEETSAAPGWTLTPRCRLLWRGDGSIELRSGTDDRGVVVTGLDRRVSAALARPRRRSLSMPVDRLADLDEADRLALDRLVELGYVTDVGDRTVSRRVPAARNAAPGPLPPDRLPPLAVRPDERVGPARGVARVQILGLSPVAAYLGAVLAAEGVGHVAFGSAGAVRRGDVLPGGLSPADEGRRFAAAAAAVVRAAAPSTDTGPLPTAAADLVVLCHDAPVEPDLHELLHSTRRAHLPVLATAGRGEVGPLVLPGLTSCLRCADLHRLDRDPSWSVLALQLMTAGAVAPVVEPALAAQTASLAAAMSLRYLDSGEPAAARSTPPEFDASWELRVGRSVARRRSRANHPHCPCGSPGEPGSPGGPGRGRARMSG